MKKLGYFWNGELARRKAGVLCPEVPARIELCAPHLVLDPSWSAQHYDFVSRDSSILSPVHSVEYIDFVRTAYQQKKRALDSGDTRVTPDIFPQALLAASAGCEALDKILQDEILRAFCCVRPPGHHANATRALGFCVFNNAAVAARYAQAQGLSKILIVDWDVHPGNGTQEIFWEDDSVFVLSLHQDGLFGESGSAHWQGQGNGLGFTRNICFPEGTGGDVYIPRFRQELFSVCTDFLPRLIILSAGFDAHQRDPAANIQLSTEDYGQLTRIICEAAQKYCHNRLLSLLEGGYNVFSLVDSVKEHCRVLASS